MKIRPIILVIVLFGLNSFFADIIYEGARSIMPNFLRTFGYTVFQVGIIIGSAELVGYLFRLISGYVSTKSRRYWILMVTGYVGTLTVPLMAFTDSKGIIIALIFMERIAKGIRSSPKNAIVSILVQPNERGKAFGFIEVFDEFGAMLGPVILSYSLWKSEIYQQAIKFLLIPFAFVVLMQMLLPVVFYKKFSQSLASSMSKEIMENGDELNLSFFVFVAIVSLNLIFTYPISINLVISEPLLSIWSLPLLYLVVHTSDLVAASIIGNIYHKKTNKPFYFLFLVSIFTFVPLFVSSSLSSFISASAFGIILGINESAVRARVSDETSTKNRGKAFGILNFATGMALFISNGLFGLIAQMNNFQSVFGIVFIFLQILLLSVYRKIN